VTWHRNDPHHRSRPGVGPESIAESRPTPWRPQSSVAFGLILGCLTMAMLGCMTVTRFLTPVPVTAPGIAPSDLPVFEHDYGKTLELIGTGQAQRLVELAAEGQQPPMYQAGTQKYTVNMASTQVVDLGYDWCTKTSAILTDNRKHITVSVTVNGHEIPSEDLQAIDWSVPAGGDPQFPDGLVCHSWAILASNWPTGESQVTEVATFDSNINDGYDDYGAGAYRYEYQVVVSGPGPSASGGNGRPASWNEAMAPGRW
jgi:hypothetical protein